MSVTTINVIGNRVLVQDTAEEWREGEKHRVAVEPFQAVVIDYRFYCNRYGHGYEFLLMIEDGRLVERCISENCSIALIEGRP